MTQPHNQRKNTPFCLRLPHDLHAAVVAIAAQQGVTASEWLRDMIYRFVYNETPSVDEGYIHGRQLGFRMAHLAIAQLGSIVPPTVEEAMAALQAGSAGRTPHQ